MAVDSLPPPVQPKSIKFAIDRGGTFTDVWAAVPGRPDITVKLLSVDPSNYDDAPAEGIRRVLEMVSGTAIPRRSPIPKELIHSIRMGTTVATNALLERKGRRHAFIVTKGFGDLLDIGYQARPRLFDLGIRKPELLYDEVVEISERITPEGYTEDKYLDQRPALKEMPGVFVKAMTGDILRIVSPLNEDEVRTKLAALQAKGIDTLAICLAHSYLYPKHEDRIAEIAAEMGFGHISRSSAVGTMIKMISRGSSASADAYLTPEITRYISGFSQGFAGGSLDGVSCEFMQSDGGLVKHDSFSGLKGILSGPAGGVVGFARTSYDGTAPIVGFDMGGTSTDVSRYGGSFEHVFETTTAGVSIQSPQLDINTVASGGGSILFWANGMFKVGPESASAHPGPASYRKGGPLTITDANLFLGRLVPDYFPSIFGPNEDLPLDYDIVAEKFAEITRQINKDTGKSMTPQEVANGFIDVANESMSRPIRAITEARGYETSQHHLATFGGAGGQHACEMAEKLGIRRIVIHKYSSILSAYGMALAEIVQEAQEPSSETLCDESMPRLQERFRELKRKVADGLLSQEIKESSIKHEVFLNLRYHGTDTNFMISEPADGDWRSALEVEHYRELTFTFPRTRPVFVDDIRVRSVGTSDEISHANEQLVEELKTVTFAEASKGNDREVNAYFTHGGLQPTKVFRLSNLAPGAVLSGPAILIDNTQTIVLVPQAKARILTSHVVIDLPEAPSKQVNLNTQVVDPIKLSIFGHRFMSIAEQMGRTLQKTSISLNIKERLDFSCAIFSPDGELVANAPHVPVHLGSMSFAVKYQHELHRGKLRKGDVIVTNHPEAGGTHLPDITVITPVFDEDGKTICFYTASRGHHLDIGGYMGNSMPPTSTALWQEGAAIKSFFLIRDGKFDEEGIVALLLEPGKYPDCNGSRQLGDNLSDLKAQVAANQKGSNLIQALMDEYGKATVHFYMAKIQENAEVAVRAYLKSAFQRFGGKPLRAKDYLDNGSMMQVTISIDENGFGIFDFTGTSCEMLSNMNAPPAITYSALIYTLRLLIGSDIPLNQGCLAPTEVIIPKNTFLNPSSGPAVCCGNTLTSQRLVDLLLKAFRASAGSQGCMNCFGFFGNSVPPASDAKDGEGEAKPKELGFGFGYGETICGGEGAGPTWHGASAVQIHMTNTRTTDIEIIEKRYPVLIREFSIRRGSGGRGKFNGGSGIIRDFESRAPLTYGLITERRVHQPYGMMGGENGESGANFWVQKLEDGGDRWINIGSRGQVDMNTGDRCVVWTPGGGGWGVPDDAEESEDEPVALNGTNGVRNGDVPKESYPRATGSFHAFSAAQAASS